MTRIGSPVTGLPTSRPDSVVLAPGSRGAGPSAPISERGDYPREGFRGGLRQGKREGGLPDQASDERGLPFRRFLNAHADPDEEIEEPTTRLLAVVEYPVPASMNACDKPSTGAPHGLGDALAAPARMARLADRIAEAARADRLARLEGAQSFEVPVAGAIDGLASISIAISSECLDITLLAQAGCGSINLAGDAYQLAQHLQTRFCTRRVRILESVAGTTGTDDAPAACKDDGLAVISRLLGGGRP